MSAPLSVEAKNEVKCTESCKECCPAATCKSSCCIIFFGRRIKHKKKEKEDMQVHKVYFDKNTKSEPSNEN
jgi:hypothetical protein